MSRARPARAPDHGLAERLLLGDASGLERIFLEHQGRVSRAESLALFQGLGREGLHVVISSHILHEVERISDHVVLLSHGYVVAEGQVHGMRSEVTEHPMQILVRCSAAQSLAARLFTADHVVEVKLHPDGQGLLVRTRDADAFHRQLNLIVLEEQIELEAVAPADDDVNAGRDFVWNGPGLAHLRAYLLVTVLACLGYGAVFLALGSAFRNPIVPAMVFFLFEGINGVLPVWLKHLSVTFYVKPLCPVELPIEGISGLFTVVAEPTPPWLAVSGLLAFVLLVVALACWRIRKLEISYSTD